MGFFIRNTNTTQPNLLICFYQEPCHWSNPLFLNLTGNNISYLPLLHALYKYYVCTYLYIWSSFISWCFIHLDVLLMCFIHSLSFSWLSDYSCVCFFLVVLKQLKLQMIVFYIYIFAIFFMDIFKDASTNMYACNFFC